MRPGNYCSQRRLSIGRHGERSAAIHGCEFGLLGCRAALAATGVITRSDGISSLAAFANPNKKGQPKLSFFVATPPDPSRCSVAEPALQRVVHVELDRVRGLTQTRDLTHFEFNVSVEHAVGEDAALGQEAAVCVEAVERLVLAMANRWHQSVFFRRQMVQIFGGGFARMDLVFDAVQTGHHQG